MSNLPKVTLRARIYVVIAIGVTLIAAAVISIGSAFPNLMQTSDEVRGRLLPAATAATDLRVHQGDMARSLRAWALNGQQTDFNEHMTKRNLCNQDLQEVRRLLQGTDDLGPLLTGVEQSYAAYVMQISDQVIRLRQEGQAVSALQLAFSPTQNSLFASMDGSYLQLRKGIFERRDAEVAQLHSSLVRLGGTLASIALVILLLLAVGWASANGWVLRPLDDLREQMRRVARDSEHELPITASGPAEIAAVGRDAEVMRRRLVGEIDEARAAREALGQDAPGVAAIRRELFPDHASPDLDHYVVHGAQSPAQGVLAGDWWDTIRLGESRIAVCIADVAGHGPVSGIAALRIKHTVSLVLGLGGTPTQAMRRIAETFDAEQSLFATAFLMVIDLNANTAQWVNAGHIPPLLLRSVEPHRTLEPTGPLLSSLGGTWSVGELQFFPGDIVLVATDGLIESHDAHGVMLAEDGFAQIVQSHYRITDDPVDLIHRVIASIRERASDWGRDDATLVAISRRE